MSDLKGADLGLVLICAVRYALPRQTYVGGCIASQVARLWSEIPARDQETIVRDVREALDSDRAGDPRIDAPEWRRMLERVGG